MNRSLMRRAYAASRATERNTRYGAGDVQLVAVFPDGSFYDQVPALFSGTYRPIAWGRWWKPENPANPWGGGTAIVALPGDSHGGRNEVWQVEIFEEEGGFQSYPPLGIGGILDKPHRVRNTANSRLLEEDEVYLGATELFAALERDHHFLPVMDGWLGGEYGGKWYLPLHWRWELNPPTCELGDVVWLMDDWRKLYGASIRVHAMHHRRGQLHPGGPERAEDAASFLLSYLARLNGDPGASPATSRTFI
jgi:hypothetical protein